MAGSWNVGAQSLPDRRLPPRRRLAADGHDGRPPAALLRQAALPAGRDLALRLRRGHRAQGPILEADDFIDLVFTRGIYGVFPMINSIQFMKLSTRPLAGEG